MTDARSLQLVATAGLDHAVLLRCATDLGLALPANGLETLRQVRVGEVVARVDRVGVKTAQVLSVQLEQGASEIGGVNLMSNVLHIYKSSVVDCTTHLLRVYPEILRRNHGERSCQSVLNVYPALPIVAIARIVEMNSNGGSKLRMRSCTDSR